MSIPDTLRRVATQRVQRSQRRSAGPRKGERREQAILDAADRLLATTAFTELTMEDLATEAGLSRSAMYFYFGSKEDVLIGLHQTIYEAMVDTMAPISVEGAPMAEAMGEAIQRVCDNWRAHPYALRTFHETAMVSSSFGDIWRQRLEQHVNALTLLIEREIVGGRAAPGPPSPRAIASSWFWMLEHQFYALFRDEHAERDEHELVATLTVLWLRMIGAR